MKSQKPVPEISAVPSVDINSPLKIDEARETDINDEQNHSKVIFYIGLTCFCLIVGLVVVILISAPALNGKHSGLSKSPVPSATPVTASLTLSPKDWNIEVLNGSGIPGRAKTAADKLKLLGFNSVLTGNYKEIITGNQFFLSSATLSQQELFGKYLSLNSITATYSGILTDSTVSARLILGK